jgi:hypothetical protein
MNTNPIAEEKGDDFKKEVLIVVGSYLGNTLKRLNKDEITKEDLDDANTEALAR